MHTRTRLVHHINCLVRQIPIGDVPVAQANGGVYGFVHIVDAVVLFVFVLNVLKYLDRLIDGRGIDHDLLEATVKSPVFLDVLAILVERRRPDTLELTTSQCGLEHV